MSEEKPPEFHIPFPTEDFIRSEAVRINSSRDLLQKLAEVIATISMQPDDELADALQIEHIKQASTRLTQLQAEFTSGPHADVFLSYSTKDEDFARELVGDLNKAGISSFLAPMSIKPGARWPEEIWEALRASRVFVLIVTADALKSKWCLLEIGAACVLRKVIIAVLRHSSRMPDVLKSVQAIKVQTTKQQKDLVRQIKELCMRGGLTSGE